VGQSQGKYIMNKQQLKNGRKNEVIGGGFFVFRRGKTTGRIGCGGNTLPFEHGSFEAAATEAKRLSEVHPGETFSIFEEAWSYPCKYEPPLR